MTACRPSIGRQLIVVATLCVTMSAVSVQAAFQQTNTSTAAKATWTGAGGSAATGRCMLLVTFMRTRALGHCTIEGGAPLTSIRVLVDGFESPVADIPVSGSGPFSFSIDPFPTTAFRALPAGGLRVEGMNGAGVETTGVFEYANDHVQFSVPIHTGEVVGPSTASAVAFCHVTLIGLPSFLGVDCIHDMADARSLAIHTAGPFETGDVSLDLSDSLGVDNPAYWQPLEADLRLIIASDGTYLRMVGPTDDNAIRGQITGCRTSASTVCLFGRFRVQANGQPTDESLPQIPASGDILTAPFRSLEQASDEFALTQTVLFSTSADRDQSLLVEMVDSCSTGLGIILNVTGTDFERFQYFVFFSDLFFGFQDAMTTAGGLRLERRRAFAMPCPPQTVTP